MVWKMLPFARAVARRVEIVLALLSDVFADRDVQVIGEDGKDMDGE